MRLKGKKVLVVDDDEFFRETLKQCLEEEGAKVMSVESVEFAKRAVTLFSPDAILSDVQMPGLTGVDLLVWIKTNHAAIPVIIMTGFSEIVDAASAAAAGASAFLAKPFQQEELFDVIELASAPVKKENVPQHASAHPVKADEFMKISIEDFVMGSQIRFPIYLEVPSVSAPKYIKIAHQGEDLSLERIRSYRSKGVKHLFLQKSDYLSYVGFTVQLTKASTQVNAISAEKRARMIRHTMELVQQQFHTQDLSEEAYDHASTMVEVSVSALTGNDAGLLILDSLKDISDDLYAHAVGVSMIAALIGNALGWTAPKTLFKIATAGMLHDIGKKQLKRELAIMPCARMTADELFLYESHTTKGMEILNDLRIVPAEVIQAVYQHHERANKTGFPRRLSGDKISPIAKVIAVADEFCGLYLSTAGTPHQDLEEALKTLIEFRSEGLSPECLNALYKAFDRAPPMGNTIKKRGFA